MGIKLEVGDYLKVKEPDSIVEGFDMTKDDKYIVSYILENNAVLVLDDVGELAYITEQEILKYCDLIKSNEVTTEENKEKRESTMLKVNVDTTEECVEDKWVKGNILSNEEGSLVIMVIETKYATGVKTEVIPLIDKEFHHGTFRLDTSSKEFWLEKCPILVKDASLNINIRKEVAK